MANNAASGANLGFESELWRAADELRSNMDAAEYKHVVLGRGSGTSIILSPEF